MKIVALIDHDRQPDVVERILKHCKLWKEPGQRGPPPVAVGDALPPGLTYDPGYFDKAPPRACRRECA
jgi:hypothetical protein